MTQRFEGRDALVEVAGLDLAQVGVRQGGERVSGAHHLAGVGIGRVEQIGHLVDRVPHLAPQRDGERGPFGYTAFGEVVTCEGDGC